MAAISYTVVNIAEKAESIGYRAWFDFATCYIHRMRGKEIARFEMDNGRNFRVSADFLADMISAYDKEFTSLIALLANAGEAQSRDGLYVVFDKSFGWWNVRELPDGSGANNVGANSFDAMYTKRGAERIKARYDVARTCEVRAVEGVIQPRTGDDTNGQSGQNNPGASNNNFFRSNF